jgi:hypothetical protein
MGKQHKRKTIPYYREQKKKWRDISQMLQGKNEEMLDRTNRAERKLEALQRNIDQFCITKPSEDAMLIWQQNFKALDAVEIEYAGEIELNAVLLKGSKLEVKLDAAELIQAMSREWERKYFEAKAALQRVRCIIEDPPESRLPPTELIIKALGDSDEA